MGGDSRETVHAPFPQDVLSVRVLRLALEHHGVRAIARKVKRSPSTVSRILGEWVSKGYIVNSAPRGSTASFERGPNLPKELFHRLFPDETALATRKTVGTVGHGIELFHEDYLPVIGGPIEEGFIPLRIHSLGHRFKVQKKDRKFCGPTRYVPWTSNTKNSGVPIYVLKLPVNGHSINDERYINIVYREGKNSQSIEVWTPEVIITNPIALQEFDKWAAARAQRVANWLSRRYGFKLGVVQLACSPHFAAAVPDEVARAAKEIGLRTPDLWMDNSRGRGELETDDKSRAVSIMDMPTRFDRLERVIYDGVGPTLEKMVESQERLYGEFSALNEYLRKLLGTVEKPSDVSKSNDTDPGGMFG